MSIKKMSEIDVVQLAESYAKEHGIQEGIERVSFVDADDLPDRLRGKGSFWVVAFFPPKQTDVVVEHAGVVLNIGDSDQLISVV